MGNFFKTIKKEDNKPNEEKKIEPNIPNEEKKIEPTINIEDQFKNLNISEEQEKFDYKVLISGIKNQKFKQIVFLTGAGISVSAGIPDFRTPGTGLYSKLQEYNLPYPEAVFEISYFDKNPAAFYTLSKGFLTSQIKPTTSHFFQKMIYDLGSLKYIYTQNIDGLELDVGIPLEKLLQAHGHMRSCHCINCHAEHDNKKMMENIENQNIFRCDKNGCNGLIKPDIVFFGESLPLDFFTKSNRLKEADLVIVMGTSLVVFPFASLVKLIPKKVPVVLINREDSFSQRKQGDNYLFLVGDLDQNVENLVKDLHMKEAYEQIKKETLGGKK